MAIGPLGHWAGPFYKGQLKGPAHVLQQVEIHQGLGPVKAQGTGGYQLIDAGKVRRHLPWILGHDLG